MQGSMEEERGPGHGEETSKQSSLTGTWDMCKGIVKNLPRKSVCKDKPRLCTMTHSNLVRLMLVPRW